jgi:hypothetical protein
MKYHGLVCCHPLCSRSLMRPPLNTGTFGRQAMRPLDPLLTYKRGLNSRTSLDDAELFVFAVMELEALMDMEGWEHFFCSPQSAGLYPTLKMWLAAAEDRASLAVLEDFERYLEANRVPMAPASIDQHLTTLDAASLAGLPDWRSRFAAVVEQRWDAISTHLKSLGIELVER